MDWRLLVQERIAKIAKERNHFFKGLNCFLGFEKNNWVSGYIGCFPKTTTSVLANFPTVHSEEFAARGSVAVAVGVGDM